MLKDNSEVEWYLVEVKSPMHTYLIYIVQQLLASTQLLHVTVGHIDGNIFS